MRTGQIEANLVHLNEDARLSHVDDLIARKLAGPEKSLLDDSDLDFHRREYCASPERVGAGSFRQHSTRCADRQAGPERSPGQAENANLKKNGRAGRSATSISQTWSTAPENCRMAGASSREVLRHLNTLFYCGAAGQLGDAELLEQFVAGRDEAAEAAFAALVERHGVMVLGVCRRVLGNRDEAEDAFQATFLVLAKKASAIARREQLASWLHGVARRAALDARARTARQKAREKRLGAMRPVEPPDQTMTSELRAVLDEELAHLPERHRAAILLCELEGLSRRDAAIRLGISEGTLSSRLARAKSRLKDRLTRRGFALSSAALASILTHDAHAVILPPVLLDSTIRVATLVAAGSSLAGVVSTSVATLSEGVSKPCCWRS